MKVWWLLPILLICSGCIGMPRTSPPWVTQNAACDNPTLVAASDPEYVWEQTLDVLDDYFDIEQERPVQVLDQMVMTEGRIDTLPRVGATIFEPWYDDSPDWDSRVESTLQPIRRRAVVRVRPETGGFLVDVAVYKEREIVDRRANTSAGAATFRYDSSPSRIAQPLPSEPTSAGWESLGRDHVLEQRIIRQIQDRMRPR